jgi:hypothetical protein
MIRYGNRHMKLFIDDLVRIFFVDNTEMVEYIYTNEQEEMGLYTRGIV